MYFKNGLLLLKKKSFFLVIQIQHCDQIGLSMIWTGLEYKNYRPVSICKYDRKYHVDPIIHQAKVMG